MARARAVDNRSRSKATLIEEVSRGIEQFQDILSSIEDFSREGFPYRDAARAKAELQLRECVRRIFGERSSEYQTYRNYKLRTGNKGETGQSMAVVKQLIHNLEDRKLELQGLKPPPPPEPVPITPPPAPTPMSLVPPAPESLHVLTPVPVPAAPMTVSVAMTTNLTAPPALPQVADPPHPVVPAAAPSNADGPKDAGTSTGAHCAAVATTGQTPAADPPSQPASLAPAPAAPQTPPPPATPAVQAIVSPSTPTPATPSPTAIAPPAIASIPPARPAAPPDAPAGDESVATSQVKTSAPSLDLLRSIPATDQETLELIRKVCVRFHAVTRQLRLRKDYRPTLEVEDDHDLQDLLCALLKVEFDEVGIDEWTPPYGQGAPSRAFLVNHDHITVVAKKTRPGLTTKELAEQIAADSAYYGTRATCRTLFCFIYDPEGRIGSPKRLETDLTSVSDRYTIEVLVAPK